MPDVYQIKFTTHASGATLIEEKRHYQSWESLSKWWNKFLADRIAYTNSGTSYQFGMEAYWNGQLVGAYVPWKNNILPLNNKLNTRSFPALDRMEAIANLVADDIQRKGLLASIVEVRFILGL